MVNAADVKHCLALLAGREMSLNAFERWLESNIWDVEQDSAQDAWELVYSIQLLFSERNNRRYDADALRRHIVALNNNAVMSFRFDGNLRAINQPVPDFSEGQLYVSPHPEPVRAFVLRPA